MGKFLIGMIHLPPMPGSVGYSGMDGIVEKALLDLGTLERAGFDAALVENDNDRPQQIGISREVEQAFRLVMGKIESQASIPVGLQAIYDMKKTIEIAAYSNAPFVRLDVFVDSVQTKWGKVLADPAKLASMRSELAPNMKLFTDVHVKHGKMLERKTISESVKQAVGFGSNGIIVTGRLTGIAPSSKKCAIAKKASNNTLIFVGSGLTIENAPRLLSIADGAIVGTSIKEGIYVSYAKAKALADLVHSL
ncbi:MAG: BtpA/SgcQ family protein [Candidatus Micrarchaeaceae archaeon]